MLQLLLIYFPFLWWYLAVSSLSDVLNHNILYDNQKL